MTIGQFEKLPAYARSEIQRLRYEIERLASVVARQPPSSVIANPSLGVRDSDTVGTFVATPGGHCSIHFIPRGGHVFGDDIEIEWLPDAGSLRVRTNSKRLVVLPEVTNTVTVERR